MNFTYSGASGGCTLKPLRSSEYLIQVPTSGL